MGSNQLKIYRWRRKNSPNGNFGDEITIPILDRLFGIRAEPSPVWRAQLLGAGSILDHYAKLLQGRGRLDPLRRLAGRFTHAPDLHVWGTGAMSGDLSAEWPQRLHFSAVRGPLTSEVVGSDCPHGDPGILASRLVDRPRSAHPVGVVPHYEDMTTARTAAALPSNWLLIDPEGPTLDVIRQIGSCELILSSSLHGLIVADSFGIPCVWADRLRPQASHSNFKFDDYAASRGKPFNAPVHLTESISSQALSSLATTPERDVAGWQDALIRSFPLA